MTTVVNKYKDKYDVYIGRGSLWGNPYVIGKHGSREFVIACYKDWFLTKLAGDPKFREETHKLRGKVLGCFCKPKPCHGDIIAKFLDDGQV